MRRQTVTLSVVVLLFAASFIWWIDRPNVRYAFVGGGWECSVRQFVNLPTDEIDLIAIGSSRVRAGLDLAVVASRSEGEVRSFYNFSRTGIGPMRNYVIFRDLVEKGVVPKFAYVEVDTEAFLPRYGGYQIQIYRDVGFLKFSDLVHLYRSYSGATELQRIHTVAAHALKKIGDSLIFTASGRIWEANSGLDEEAPRVCWRPYYDTKSKRKNAAIAKRMNQYKERFGDIWKAQFDVVQDFTTPQAELELYSFNLVRELAAEHNIRLISGRHWRAYEPPVSDASLAALTERVPEFIYPNEHFVRSTWHDFVDPTHMFSGSRNRVSRWVADQMFAPKANQ